MPYQQKALEIIKSGSVLVTRAHIEKRSVTDGRRDGLTDQNHACERTLTHLDLSRLKVVRGPRPMCL